MNRYQKKDHNCKLFKINIKNLKKAVKKSQVHLQTNNYLT